MTHSDILKRTWREKRALLLLASRKGGQASRDLPQRAQLERAWRTQRTVQAIKLKTRRGS